MLRRILAWIRDLFFTKAPPEEERPRQPMVQPLEDRQDERRQPDARHLEGDGASVALLRTQQPLRVETVAARLMPAAPALHLEKGGCR